jgi:plastocyanin
MKKLNITLVISLVFSISLYAQVVITAVFDGPLSGGLPKGVELYVPADIADLSHLGIGGANNGGGTDSVEFSFPAMSVPGESYLYVSSETPGFTEFFGFSPDFDTDGNPNAMAINGDDAIELFWDGVVIDVFGDINVDGSGTDWEYLDGWVARKPQTGPDGSTFVLQNWNYSGPDALDGASTNATAANPVPLKSYVAVTVDPDVVVILQNLQFIERDIVIEVGQTVRWSNVENSVQHNVNGGLGVFPCNPVGFFSGVAEVGPWDFDFTFNLAGLYNYQCDPHTAFDMFGTVTVIDPNAPDYPVNDIATMSTENASGIADSIGKACTLSGVVYGKNLRPANSLLFTIIDDSGNGIAVFKGSSDCYEVTEGDAITVQGAIDQFAGLTQIESMGKIVVNSQGNQLLEPVLVEEPLGEQHESKFIRIENVGIDSVQSFSTGFNVFGTNENGVYLIRLDIDVFPDEQNAVSLIGETVNVRGIGSQFDFDEPHTEGYQIMPRHRDASDIDILSSVEFLDKQDVSVYPNPVTGILHILTDHLVESIELYSISGKLLLQKQNEASGILDLEYLETGMYILKVTTQNGIWCPQIVNQE